MSAEAGNNVESITANEFADLSPEYQQVALEWGMDRAMYDVAMADPETRQMIEEQAAGLRLYADIHVAESEIALANVEEIQQSKTLVSEVAAGERQEGAVRDAIKDPTPANLALAGQALRAAGLSTVVRDVSERVSGMGRSHTGLSVAVDLASPDAIWVNNEAVQERDRSLFLWERCFASVTAEHYDVMYGSPESLSAFESCIAEAAGDDGEILVYNTIAALALLTEHQIPMLETRGLFSGGKPNSNVIKTFVEANRAVIHGDAPLNVDNLVWPDERVAINDNRTPQDQEAA